MFTELYEVSILLLIYSFLIMAISKYLVHHPKLKLLSKTAKPKFTPLQELLEEQAMTKKMQF